MSTLDDYDLLRAERPELLSACIEVGSCVACAPEGTSRIALAAAAEARAVEIVASLVRASR